MPAGGARLNSGPKPKERDWGSIQKDYDDNYLTIRQICTKYKLQNYEVRSAVKRGLFSRRLMKIERVLSGSGEPYGRERLKASLLKYGFLKNECSECGQKPDWNGKILVMVLDHKNGINNDNRKFKASLSKL